MNEKLIIYILPLIIFIVPILSSCNKFQTYILERDGYASINGTEIYYKRIGSGEPIMIVHGGPGLEHGYLVPYFEPFSRQFEVIYFDQRLSGRSSADVDSSEIRLDKFVDDIEELRKELNLGKIHLVGHSWGGLLAMKYAIKYDSKLRSLTLLNSMAASSELKREEEKILAQKTSNEFVLQRQALLDSELFETNKPQAIEKLLLLSFRSQFYDPSYADSLDFYVSDDYMARSQRLGHLMVDIANYDLLAELSSLRIPTLLVYGAIEPAASVSGPILHSTIQNSKLVVIENAGHFPFVEQPDRFVSELLKFVKSN